MKAEEMSIDELRAALAKKEGEAPAAASGSAVEVEAGGFKAKLDMRAAASYRAHKIRMRVQKAAHAAEAANDQSAIEAANVALAEYYDLVFGSDQLDAIAAHITERDGEEASYESVVLLCSELLKAAGSKK